MLTLALLELVLRAIILIAESPAAAAISALYRYRSIYSTEGLVMRGLMAGKNFSLNDEALMYAPHPTRGWSMRPNMDIWVQGYKYTTNSHGHRGAGEPDLTKPRVMLLGNSQTFGDEVDDVFVLSNLAQQQLPALSFVNLAVSGYGFDQMYITLKEEYVKWKPRYVVFMVIGDDFHRVGYRHKKPYFKLEKRQAHPDRAVLVLEGPSDASVHEVKGSWRHHLRYFASVNVSLNLADRIQRSVYTWPQNVALSTEMMRSVLETARGMSTVGLIYLSFNHDEESFRSESGSAPYKLFSDLCTTFGPQGLVCGDTTDARRKSKGLRTSKGHYFRLGNEIAAAQLVKLLRSRQ